MICAAFALFIIPLPGQLVGGTTETIFEWDSISAGDELGFSVADAGDVNGDGIRDLIGGSPRAHAVGHGHAGVAHVISGADGSIILKFHGQVGNDRFGESVASAGDVNADGFADLIIGASAADPNGILQSGSAYVYSGADGSLLYQMNGIGHGDHFGSSVSGAGDANNDGFDDFLVGADLADGWGNGYAGSASLYSGFDGSLIREWFGGDSLVFLGCSVSAAGDLNGDGFDDQIVGAYGADSFSHTAAGVAKAFSGLDGSVLFLWRGSRSNESFGKSVASAGDVNGDGVMDVVIGSNGSEIGALGGVQVYSGANGSLIHRWNGMRSDARRLGVSVSGGGDVNGDGFADVLAGADHKIIGGYSGPGAAFLFSGATGRLLKQWDGASIGDAFGYSVAVVDDLNTDQLADVAIGSPSYGTASSAFVFSYRPFLTTSSTTISAALGGTLHCELAFPIEASGYMYKILISASGIGPTTHGVDIPLTLDRWVAETFRGNYARATTLNMHGTLDSVGTAAASITFAPPLPSAIVGRIFVLAAIANPPGQLAEYSSVAVPLEITP